MVEAGTTIVDVVTVPGEEWRAMQITLSVIEARLNDALPVRPPVMNIELPEKAKAVRLAIETARARGYFSVKEFAVAVGRCAHWVSGQCKARVIKCMLGRKPYRIPFEQYEIWMRRIDEPLGPRNRLRM